MCCTSVIINYWLNFSNASQLVTLCSCVCHVHLSLTMSQFPLITWHDVAWCTSCFSVVKTVNLCCSWSRVIEEMHTWSFSILILPMQVLVAYWNILNLYNFCYLYVLAGFLTGGIFKCWVHDADLGKCNRMYRWVHSDAVYLSVMLHWLQLLCFSFAVYIIVITEADWVSDQANH